MFRYGNFDKMLDKATSHLLMEPDWPNILQICDQIRQNDVPPKQAVAGVRKKLLSENPHTAMYALLVLESMVKNCGPHMHEELTLKQNCEFLHDLAKQTPHQNVKQKLLELIQAWSYAFRKNPKHSALKELMNAMKLEGYSFPALRESDAMFSADTAPEWTDGDMCHRCRVTFSLIQRKHHCRACGQVFCGQCSSKTTTLPKYGIEKEVRVCDACFDQANKPLTTKVTEKESDLPLEYVNSTLAQQNQEPPRKTEEELREEEELQLALALSQSEAEAKEKEKMKITTNYHSIIKTEPRPAERSPTPPQEESNPELARYLNRPYWESLNATDTTDQQIRATSPTAPVQNNDSKYGKQLKENGLHDNDLEEFIKTLKSQVEIFINRMKSNSSRGRSIANDTSVQTLFLNITAMHSKLLRYIQQHDDSRLHYERLQDKLTQMKDARAALDALRDEHREKLRREAEDAERQRQLQMAHKLDIMRKKKQEYLQYQRELALRRIQEQEREMQMRQEQQKQQYLMGPQFGGYAPSQQYAPQGAAPLHYGYGYGQPMMGQMPGQGPQMLHNGGPPGSLPPQSMPMGHPPGLTGPPNYQNPTSAPSNLPPGQQWAQSGPQMTQNPPGMPLNPGMPQNQPGMHPSQQGMPQTPQGMPQNQQAMPQNQQGMPQNPPGMPQNQQGMPQPSNSAHNMQNMVPNQGIPPQGIPPQYQQPGAPTSGPPPKVEEAQTAELISFD